MNEPSHQTLRLSRGRHVSPRDGACVMELASMLAGEPFGDHPRSACPVLGTIMRCYNDGIDDDRRQDLYWCASAVVGTRSRPARMERLRRAAEFFDIRLSWAQRRLPRFALHAIGRAALHYANSATGEQHRAFLSFVDELVGVESVYPSEAPERSFGARRSVA